MALNALRHATVEQQSIHAIFFKGSVNDTFALNDCRVRAMNTFSNRPPPSPIPFSAPFL